MHELHTIEYVYYYSQIIAMIIGILGVGVTIIGIYKYIEYKRIDAVIGFYSKLLRLIRLLENTLGDLSKRVNLFYVFCDDVELRENIPAIVLKNYEYYRTELISLVLHSDDQIDITPKKWKIKNNKNDGKISELIDNLIDELNKYAIIEHPQILFHVDGKKQADETNVAIKKIIQDITSMIIEEKNKLTK